MVSLVRLAGAGLLGVMLAAPLVLLFLQYEPLAFNVHKPGSASGSETDPQWGLLNWLVPFFQQPPTGVDSSVRNWFGIGVGIAALAAMSGRAETKRLHTWLFVALGVAVLLKVYEFRVLDWIGRLPVLEQVVFTRYLPPVGSFAFAVLAGIGVQVVRRRDLRLRRFFLLLATSSLLLLVFVRTGDRWTVITSAPLDYAATVWGRGLLVALVAVAAVVLAARFGKEWGAPLLACVIVGELLVLAPFDIYARRADPFLAPGWMTLVRNAQGSDPNSRVFGIDGQLYPNTAGALGLQDIRALDALHVERYQRYIQTFIQPAMYDRFTGSDGRPARFKSNPMFDALGVRAILTPRDLANVPGLLLLGRDGDTRVYENVNAYPRAWVVHDLHLVGGEDAAFRYLEARADRRGGAFVVDEFDPRHEAVVEVNGTTADEQLRALRGGCAEGDHDRATIERYSGDSVSLRVEAACAGLLVLPDTYFPGWKATRDGHDQPIYPTNGALRGVTVPAGTSRVEFHYEPRAFPTGVALAAAGLAGFVVIGLVPRLRTRIRRPRLPDPHEEGVQA
jgi:hypothetical protein